MYKPNWGSTDFILGLCLPLLSYVQIPKSHSNTFKFKLKSNQTHESAKSWKFLWNVSLHSQSPAHYHSIHLKVIDVSSVYLVLFCPSCLLYLKKKSQFIN